MLSDAATVALLVLLQAAVQSERLEALGAVVADTGVTGTRPTLRPLHLARPCRHLLALDHVAILLMWAEDQKGILIFILISPRDGMTSRVQNTQ